MWVRITMGNRAGQIVDLPDFVAQTDIQSGMAVPVQPDELEPVQRPADEPDSVPVRKRSSTRDIKRDEARSETESSDQDQSPVVTTGDTIGDVVDGERLASDSDDTERNRSQSEVTNEPDSPGNNTPNVSGRRSRKR